MAKQQQQQQQFKYLFEDFHQVDDFERYMPQEFKQSAVLSIKQVRNKNVGKNHSQNSPKTKQTVSNRSGKSKIAAQRRSAKVEKQATNIIKTAQTKSQTKSQTKTQ